MRARFLELNLMPQNPYLAIERGAPGRIGWRIHYFDEIDSTQEAARELAASGADQGTLVIAERQTAGRGRMGRAWHSPSGVNLYTTIILRPPIPLADVPRLSLVAGIAAAEALEREAPGIVGLKWPNDVWLNGRYLGRQEQPGPFAFEVTSLLQAAALTRVCFLPSAAVDTSPLRAPLSLRI